MSTIPVKIMLHGLIALVPVGGADHADHMTALLIDGRTPPARECMAPHAPILRFNVKETAQCEAANCEFTGDVCTCNEETLAGKEISIEISPSPALPGENLTLPLAHGLPADASEAGQFRYVAQLSGPPFNMNLDPKYLVNPLPADARSILLARMTIPFSSLTACSLAQREDGGVFNVHALAFRKIGDGGTPNEVTQAIAQMVVADLEVPDASPGDQKVRLKLRDFSGASQEVLFDLVASNHGYMIEVSNEAVNPPDKPDTPCDDGVARHFTFFYSLASSPPDEASRLIPHVRLTQWKSSIGLNPKACEHPTFNASARPICPMAAY